MSPEVAFKQYSYLLTDKEPLELHEYSNIYFIRSCAPNTRLTPKYVPNFFRFIPNDHIAFRYQQLSVLGKGSFGTVIKCMDHKTGTLVAIKLLRDRKKDRSDILFENNIMSRLQEDNGATEHNIIKYFESFTFRGFFCIVMELLWKDTFTFLRDRQNVGLSLHLIKTITNDVVKALAFMYKRGIVHCDIKPENILFTSELKRTTGSVHVSWLSDWIGVQGHPKTDKTKSPPQPKNFSEFFIR